MDAEHLIRLRGGWERLEAGDGPATRVSLPLPEPPQAPCLFRLVRQFGHPPSVPGRDRVWLRLEAVPGVRRVWLDDQLAAELGPDDDRLEFEVQPQGTIRHRLTLEVDAQASPPGGPPQPWGIVALVIRSS